MPDTNTFMRLVQLNGRYIDAIDSDRLEEWPDFFLKDCLYRITTADNHRRGYPGGLVYADTRDMLKDRVASLREANIYEQQAYRHVVGQPMVTAEASGRIEARTPFLVVRIMRDGRMDLFAAGLYLDQVRDDGGNGFRFAERTVVCDNGRFDTLLAIPL
jgi:3-phenylpropionate/cinnamic acid dioxygenase small subunit